MALWLLIPCQVATQEGLVLMNTLRMASCVLDIRAVTMIALVSGDSTHRLRPRQPTGGSRPRVGRPAARGKEAGEGVTSAQNQPMVLRRRLA